MKATLTVPTDASSHQLSSQPLNRVALPQFSINLMVMYGSSKRSLINTASKAKEFHHF
jgi:hypothetical protein